MQTIQVPSQSGGPWAYTQKYIGNDGNTYDSYEAAIAADNIYNLAAKSASLTVQSQEQSLANQKELSQLTKSFLSKWADISDKAIETLQSVISGTSSSTGNSIYDSLIGDIKAQVSQFDTNYGSAMQDSVSSALTNLKASDEAVSTLRGLSKADYAGEAGKAATDAKAQGALQGQEQARELMSYGVDPTSGKFGSLTRKNALGTARNTVIAMNKARQSEKVRVGEAATALSSAANTAAGNSANLFSTLSTAKGNLLGLQTDALRAQTEAEKAKAGTITDVAKTISDIGSQYGSLGSTILGLSYA